MKMTWRQIVRTINNNDNNNNNNNNILVGSYAHLGGFQGGPRNIVWRVGWIWWLSLVGYKIYVEKNVYSALVWAYGVFQLILSRSTVRRCSSLISVQVINRVITQQNIAWTSYQFVETVKFKVSVIVKGTISHTIRGKKLQPLPYLPLKVCASFEWHL